MRIPAALMTVALLLTFATAIHADTYEPDPARIRAALQRPLQSRVFEPKTPGSLMSARRQATSTKPRRDSIWNGLLIGAAAGVGGGYLWARDLCGPNDSECFYYAGPAGVLGGAGIGAVIGAVIDALHR